MDNLQVTLLHLLLELPQDMHVLMQICMEYHECIVLHKLFVHIIFFLTYSEMRSCKGCRQRDWHSHGSFAGRWQLRPVVSTTLSWWLMSLVSYKNPLWKGQITHIFVLNFPVIYDSGIVCVSIWMVCNFGLTTMPGWSQWCWRRMAIMQFAWHKGLVSFDSILNVWFHEGLSVLHVKIEPF